jgi:aryl carrier-like protein
MPLGPSGKLDRGALPAPAHAAAAAVPAPPEPERASTPSSRPAHTETEAVLAAICREVLHRDTIAADANILALGADSLQLFAITARANARGLRMKAKDLFLHPTIASLAGHLDGRAPENETLTSVAS